LLVLEPKLVPALLHSSLGCLSHNRVLVGLVDGCLLGQEPLLIEVVCEGVVNLFEHVSYIPLYDFNDIVLSRFNDSNLAI